MKIINETCYNTDDLSDLFKRCREAVIKTVETVSTITTKRYAWQCRGAANEIALPDRMLISYWEKKFDSDPEFINYNYDTTNPRLGIVRPGKLGVVPLVALAQAADGSELRLPYKVILELADWFASKMGGGGTVESPDTKHHWDWLVAFEVRYSARAKSGSKDEAKLARAEDALYRLRTKYEDFDRLINNALLDVEYAESELADKQAVFESRKKRKVSHFEKMTKREEAVEKLRDKVSGKSTSVTISAPKRVSSEEITQ